MSNVINQDRQRAVEKIEALILADYNALEGKVVEVSAICGFRGDDSVDINLQPPAKVKIDRTSNTSLKRWIDDWCDPVYEVTLVEPHPQLEDVRSFWIHGLSRNINGTSTEASDIFAGMH
jgi:hypothetical protein